MMRSTIMQTLSIQPFFNSSYNSSYKYSYFNERVNTYKRAVRQASLSSCKKQLAQKQERQSLAAHGLSAGNYQSVSYKAFRHCLSDIDTPLVCNKKGTTFIFNQQKEVCALIKPPYFDSKGNCQPIRYILTDGVQLSHFSSLRCIELPLLLCKTRTLSAIKQVTKSLKQLLTALNPQSRSKLQQKTAPVWTTMRLTA